MRHPISLLALILALGLTGCGNFFALDDPGPEDGGTDGGSVDGGGPPDGGAGCEGRDFCACWQDPACGFISEGCLCPCDYLCPGEDPCDCACGGGPYLGCQAAACPPVECEPGEVLERDVEGCGVCVPSGDCNDLAYCDCEAVARCTPVTNIGFCECGTGCDPDAPICDCAAPPYEPTYAGCADVGCPDPGCDPSIEMFVVGADGCPDCAPRPDLP